MRAARGALLNFNSLSALLPTSCLSRASRSALLCSASMQHQLSKALVQVNAAAAARAALQAPALPLSTMSVWSAAAGATSGTGTAAEPVLQKRRPKTSTYRGVSLLRATCTFRAAIRTDGESTLHLGVFERAEHAARAFDQAALRIRPRHKAKLNFPLEGYLDQRGGLLPAPRMDAILRRDNPHSSPALAGVTKAGKPRPVLTSAYRGVCRCDKDRGWRATIGHHNKKVHLGLYVSEVDAARAYDAAALRTRPRECAKLNFSLEDYLDGQTRELLPAPDVEARLAHHPASASPTPRSEHDPLQ